MVKERRPRHRLLGTGCEAVGGYNPNTDRHAVAQPFVLVSGISHKVPVYTFYAIVRGQACFCVSAQFARTNIPALVGRIRVATRRFELS
jgi:hypothetical protein